MKKLILLLFIPLVSFGQTDWIEYFNKGIKKYASKDFTGAIADYNKSIELNPHSPEVYNNRGNAKDNLYLYAEALSDYSKAIEIYLNEINLAAETNSSISELRLKIKCANVYNNRGRLKQKLKDYKGGISDFSKAIEFDSDYAFAYMNRGVLKMDLENYIGALSDFNKAAELDPILDNVYYNRAISKYYVNDLKGACEDAKKSGSLGFIFTAMIEAACN